MKFKGRIEKFHHYMAIERHLSPNTSREYCRDIVRFQKTMRVKLRKAEIKTIRKWLNGLNGTNQPQSIHRKIAALTAYCKWMVRQKIRKDNPMDGYEKPKCEKRLAPCARRDEVAKLLTTSVHRRNPAHILRDRAMLALMYGSGLRRAEVCSVDVGHLEDGDTLRIFGKGSKERMVFLTPAARKAIDEYLATRPDAKPEEPLFLTARNQRISTRQCWSVFRQIADAAHIRKEIHPHSLRHSHATHLLEEGVDIMVLKELLGHTSVATTQNYLNLSKEHIRGAWERSSLSGAAAVVALGALANV